MSSSIWWMGAKKDRGTAGLFRDFAKRDRSARDRTVVGVMPPRSWSELAGPASGRERPTASVREIAWPWVGGRFPRPPNIMLMEVETSTRSEQPLPWRAELTRCYRPPCRRSM